jgi:hypothetical protein
LGDRFFPLVLPAGNSGGYRGGFIGKISPKCRGNQSEKSKMEIYLAGVIALPAWYCTVFSIFQIKP